MHKFKVGDKVRVVKIITEQPGWNNRWCGSMYAVVNNGKIYTINDINSTGIYFDKADYGYGYGWPSDSLELASPEYEIEHINQYRVGSLIFKTEQEAKSYVGILELSYLFNKVAATPREIVENAERVIEILNKLK